MVCAPDVLSLRGGGCSVRLRCFRGGHRRRRQALGGRLADRPAVGPLEDGERLVRELLDLPDLGALTQLDNTAEQHR